MATERCIVLGVSCRRKSMVNGHGNTFCEITPVQFEMYFWYRILSPLGCVRAELTRRHVNKTLDRKGATRKCTIISTRQKGSIAINSGREIRD